MDGGRTNWTQSTGRTLMLFLAPAGAASCFCWDVFVSAHSASYYVNPTVSSSSTALQHVTILDLYCIMLDCIIECYTVLYYIVLYYTILYYTILYYTILYYTILYYPILYYTIIYYTILYYTILYYTVLIL